MSRKRKKRKKALLGLGSGALGFLVAHAMPADVLAMDTAPQSSTTPPIPGESEAIVAAVEAAQASCALAAIQAAEQATATVGNHNCQTAIQAAEQASQQATSYVIQAAEQAAHQASITAIQAAEQASQQASSTAIQAAEQASQQASTTAIQAAEQASQQASATAIQAAEQASQQASTTAIQAAEQASQQASSTAVQAAEQASQQASSTAVQAAEQASQQASSTAVQAAEQASQQSCTSAVLAAEEAAQHCASSGTQAAETASQMAAAQDSHTLNIAAEEASHAVDAVSYPSVSSHAESVPNMAALNEHGQDNLPGSLSQSASTPTVNSSTTGDCPISAVEAAHQAAESALACPSVSLTHAEGASYHADAVSIADSELAAGYGALSFHFGSDAAIFSAPNHEPVEITLGGSFDNQGNIVGGTSKVINPGDALTAAEFEAVEHMLTWGSQAILLSEQGYAAGGYITIMPGDLHGASELYVPEAVTLKLINFDALAYPTGFDTVNIYGSVYAVHDTAGQDSHLNFGSLNIGSTGILSGDLPDYFIFNNYFASNSLTINVDNHLFNDGMISSPGALAIETGASLTNNGLISGLDLQLGAGAAIANTGTIKALGQNLSMYSATGSFANSGNIEAALGNINIFSVAPPNTGIIPTINFDNSGGNLIAGAAINFREAGFDSKADIYLSGGNLYSQELNFEGGRGVVDVNVGEVTGTVNSRAYEFRIAARGTTDLTIGNIEATGDPTFIMLGANLNIAGNISSAGAPLSFLSDRDIIATGNSSISSGGGEIFFAAGANIQDGGADWILTGPASPEGGQLDLRLVNTINSGGGSVTMIAYDGGNLNSGRIQMAPSSSIVSSGGDVTIIAEDRNSAAPNSIVLGSIDTSGGAVGSGNVLIAAAALPSSINISVDKVTGAASGLEQLTPGALSPRSINIAGDIRANGADISLSAGDGTANGNIFVGGRINNTPTSAGDGGSVTIVQNSANNFVVGGATVNGIAGGGAGTPSIETGAAGLAGSRAGGSIAITNSGSGGIIVNDPSTNLVAGALEGNGASYLLDAGNSAINLVGGNTIDATAAGTGNGGNIIMRGSAINTSNNLLLDASGSGAGGSGGNIELSASGAGSDLRIGNSNNSFTVSADGGEDAGSVSFTAGRDLFIDTASLSNNSALDGNGANLQFSAGRNLAITGDLSANGAGTGSGGSISLSSSSTSSFAVGNGSTNGITGIISAVSGDTGGNGGNINIANNGSGGITVDSSSSFQFAPQISGSGGSLSLDAGSGVLSLAAGAYDANALVQGSGGLLSFNGSDIVMVGGDQVALSANGAGTGSGGTVELIKSGAGTNILISSLSAGSFSLGARSGESGGDGGTVIARAGGNIVVDDVNALDTAPQGLNGTGGSIILEAGAGGNPGELSIAGSIDSAGVGSGAGGRVELISRSTNAFVINGGPAANGVEGTVAASSSGGAGGTVIIANNGTGGITLSGTAQDVTANGAADAAGGTIRLLADDGIVTIPVGNMDVSGRDGGTLEIRGRDLITSGVGVLDLSARGNDGDGGSISVTLSDPGTELTVGGGADGSLSINASGTINGGSIALRTGGDLTVNNDPASLDVAGGPAGTGGSLLLSAGENGPGDLFIDMGLDVTGGGSGGSIILATNSASTFTLGAGSSGSGVNGGLVADAGAAPGDGGTIDITNRGSGGINIGSTTNISASSSLAGGNGGTIALDAGSGTLTIPIDSTNNTLDVSGTGTNSSGGIISLTGNVVSVIDSSGTSPLTLSVGGTGNGNAGQARIVQGSGDLIIGNASGNIRIENFGSGSSAFGCANPNIDLITSGNIVFDPNANIFGPGLDGSGPSVRLRSTSAGVFITDTLDVSGTLSGNGGCITIETGSSETFEIGTGATGSNGINGNLIANAGPSGGSGGAVRVISNGNADIQLLDTSNISTDATIGNGGEIILNANQGNVVIASGTSISADAAGAGNFNGGSIRLTGGEVTGPAGANLSLSARGVGTGSGGLVSVVTNNAATGDINIGAGTSQLDIDVTSSGGGSGGTINLDAARSIIANAANLQAQGLAGNASGGTINLHAGRLNADGVLQVSGNINADAAGNGSGGNISVRLPQNAGETFTIGDATGDHYIDGVLSAAAPGTGRGGNITIANNQAGESLNIDWAANGGFINAGSAQGILGDVTFRTAGGNTPGAGESIRVLDAPGTDGGRIDGFITAFGENVRIETEAIDARMNINRVSATNGDAILFAREGTSSTVYIGEGAQVDSTGDVTICASIIDISGLVTSSTLDGNIILCGNSAGNLTVTGEGSVTLTGDGASIIEIRARPSGGTLVVDAIWNIEMGANDQVVVSSNGNPGACDGTIIVNADRSITATGGGSMTVSSSNIIMNEGSSIINQGDLSLTSGDFSLIGPCNLNMIANGDVSLVSTDGNINFNANSDGLAVNFSGGNTFSLSAGGGRVDIGDDYCTSIVRLANGTTFDVAGGANLGIFTENLILESNSVLMTSGGNPSGHILIQNAICGTPLTITTEGTGADGGLIATNNATITMQNVTAGLDVTYNSIGGNPAQLNLDAGTSFINTNVDGAVINIDSAATIAANAGSISFNADNGVFSNAGTVTAVSGSSAGRINVLSSGSLDIDKSGTLIAQTPSANGHGGSININAGGELRFLDNGTVNNLIADGVGNGNGGSILVQGSSIDFVGSGSNLDASASAGNSGTGGSITMRATTGSITDSGDASAINLAALGGVTSGAGGSILVQTGDSMDFDGALTASASARGAGAGGSINMQSSIDTGSGILSMGAGSTLTATGSATGNGGNVTIRNNSSQQLVVDDTINVSAGSTGSGGSILISNQGNGSANGGISIESALIANASGNNTTAGSIEINANPASGVAGAISIEPVLMQANGGGTSSNGGSILITGAEVEFTGAGPQRLVANAGTTGNGGTITVIASDPVLGNITTGSGAGDLQLEARGGLTGGSGGVVRLTAGNDLSITGNASNIDVTPRGNNSAGGEIHLTASASSGSGILSLAPGTGLVATGTGNGSGGTVTITNNSSQLLEVNQPVNVSAGASGTGGIIIIRNQGDQTAADTGNGGIAIDTDLRANAGANANNRHAGTIIIDALDSSGDMNDHGVVSIGLTSGAINFSANGGNNNSNGGNILIQGSEVIFDPVNNQVIQANSGNSGLGGSIAIRAVDPISGNITAGSAGGQLTLEARGGSNNARVGSEITLEAGNSVVINNGAIDLTPNATRNGGTVNITANTGGIADGTIVLNSGITATGGSTSGAGGIVRLQADSLAQINVSQPIDVSATNGAGGTIEVINQGSTNGNGGININTAFVADAAGGNFAGGTITVSAAGSGSNDNGDVLITTLPFSANGSGNRSGGRITIEGANVLFPSSGLETISANGGASGAGGNISIIALDGDIRDISAGGAMLLIEANGGSISGNGGNVTLQAAGDISLPAAIAIDVSVDTASRGGSITLRQGLSGAGVLQFGGDLNTSSNTGRAGNIDLVYNDPVNPFTIGAIGPHGYIGGNILAEATGAGIGGNITISNLDNNGVPAGNLNIDLQGLISAGTNGGTFGNINLNALGNDVIVTPSVPGTGELTGFVNSVANDIFINPQAADTTLRVGRITAQNGNAEILLSCSDDSRILINQSRFIRSETGDVTLTANTINNDGTIDGFVDVNLNQQHLINTRTIIARTGDVNIETCSPAQNLSVINNGNIRSVAGDINFNQVNAGGIINVSGTGRLQTTTANFVNFGDSTTDLTNANQVTVAQGRIDGRVSGIGTDFTVETQTSDLRSGQITASDNISLSTNGSNLLVLGPITSTDGNINLSSNQNGVSDVRIQSDMSAANGTITMISGNAAGSDVDIFNTYSVTARSIEIESPVLRVRNDASLISTNGDISVSSTAASGALNLDIRTGARIEAGADNSSIIFNTSGGNISGLIRNNALISASGENGRVLFNENGSGDINLTMQGTSTISAAGDGGLIAFNANGNGDITLAGGTNAGRLIADGFIGLNGASGNGDIDINLNRVLGSIVGEGGAVSISSNFGDLTIGIELGGFLIANTGDMELLAAGGNIDFISNAGALAGELRAESSSTGQIRLASGSDISGTSVTLTTPRLILEDGLSDLSSITSSNGEIAINSNGAANTLDVQMGENSLIASNGGNINFNNPLNQGAVTVGGPATGVITSDGGSGSVGFYGGNSGSVNVDVDRIDGCVRGTGLEFNIETFNSGGIGNLRIGNLDIVNDINATSGTNIILCGPLTSNAGSIYLTSGIDDANFVRQDNGSTVTAPGVIAIRTPNLIVGDTFTSTAGIIDISSNSDNAALAVSFEGAGASSALIANSATGGIIFNGAGAGDITISGGPNNGLIDAGTRIIDYFGGTVAVDINEINGCNRAVADTQGAFSLTTQTGDIRLDNINAAGDIAVAATGGSVTVKDFRTVEATGSDRDITISSGVAGGSINIGELARVIANDSGSTVSLTTGSGGSLNLDEGASVSAHSSVGIIAGTLDMSAGDNSIATIDGPINIDRGTSSALSVLMGENSLIEAVNNDLIFNATNPGDATIAGSGQGTISGDHIYFNGGDVSVDVDNVLGCLNTGVDVTSSQIDARSSDLEVGRFIATGDAAFRAASGDVTLKFEVRAGGSLEIASGETNQVNILASGIVEGDSVDVTTPYLEMADGSSLTSTVGDIVIDSNAADNSLTIEMTNATIDSAGDIALNNASPGAITINGDGGSTITADSGNGQIVYNSGAGDINVTIGSISGTNTGNGNETSFEVLSGNLEIGPFDAGANLLVNQLQPLGSTTANVTLKDAINVGENLAVRTGQSGAIYIAENNGNPADVNVDGSIRFDTPEIIFNGNNGSVRAGAGIAIQSNAADGSLLIDSTGSADTRLVSNTGDITLNADSAGAVTVAGGAGSLDVSAEHIVANGGTGDVSIDIDSIDGCVISNGENISIVVDNGTLDIAEAISPVDITLANITGDINLKRIVDAGNILVVSANQGQISLLDDAQVTAQNSALISTTMLNLGENSSLVATNTLTIDPSDEAPSNDININMSQGSTLGGSSIVLNAAGGINPDGDITILGVSPGQGLISSGSVIDYNLGTGNLQVDINQIIGCNRINPAPYIDSNLNPSSVQMSTQVGDIDFCTSIITTPQSGDGGAIAINAGGGSVNLKGNDVIASGSGGGDGGDISIYGRDGITDGGSITSTGANGGDITLSSDSGDIEAQEIIASGFDGNGGNISTDSQNIRVVGEVRSDGSENGGRVAIKTRSNNRLIIGDPSINGIGGDVSANGGNRGGLVKFVSRHANVRLGRTVSANGGNAGGVVTFNPLDPTITSVYDIDGLVSATGDGGVVGFGAGPNANLDIRIRGGVSAGGQITFGNLDCQTGIEIASEPSNRLRIRPFPGRNFPNPPAFDAPVVVFNGRLVPPPTPPSPGPDPDLGSGPNAFDRLFALLNSGAFFPNPNIRLFEAIESKIPTDQTPVLFGEVEQTEIYRVKGSKSRLIEGSIVRNSDFAPGSQERDRLVREGIKFDERIGQEGFATIHRGNLLKVTNKPVSWEFNQARAYLRGDAIAFAMEDGKDVAVFNFHESRPGGVKVVAGGKVITIPPGRMALISSSGVSDFDAIEHACRWVGYRKPVSEKLNDNLRAFVADFSLPSALNHIIPFKKMQGSHEGVDRKLVNKIILNAVLLQDRSSGRGTFKTAHGPIY